MEFLKNAASAAALIGAKGAKGMAFTGAGISVESGIPPFRRAYAVSTDPQTTRPAPSPARRLRAVPFHPERRAVS